MARKLGETAPTTVGINPKATKRGVSRLSSAASSLLTQPSDAFSDLAPFFIGGGLQNVISGVQIKGGGPSKPDLKNQESQFAEALKKEQAQGLDRLSVEGGEGRNQPLKVGGAPFVNRLRQRFGLPGLSAKELKERGFI